MLATDLFSEFNRKGYVTIHDIISEALLKQFRQDFQNSSNVTLTYYLDQRVGQDVLDAVSSDASVQAILKSLRSKTSTYCDLLTGGNYFAIESGVNFPFHQDHESYFFWQNHSNYLNMYFPILKPRADKSNLSVIPFDDLSLLEPKLASTLKGRGATYVQNTDAGITIRDDEYGGLLAFLPWDLAEIAETPNLMPGDALIMRGDVIHRTEDIETPRVSASLRFVSSSDSVSKPTYFEGGLTKLIVMAQNHHDFYNILNRFDQLDTQEISNLEAWRHRKNYKPSSQDALIDRLLSEKTLQNLASIRDEAVSLLDSQEVDQGVRDLCASITKKLETVTKAREYT